MTDSSNSSNMRAEEHSGRALYVMTAALLAALCSCQEGILISTGWEGAATALPDLGEVDQAPGFALTGVAPKIGSNRGGVQLTLQGTGFVPGSSVWIDGEAAKDIIVSDSTKLTATLPARPGKLGPVSIAVQSPAGEQSSRRDLFSYYAESIDIRAPRAYPLGAFCSAVAGDFDGDGKVDIAAAYGAEKSVKVFSNDGAGWLAESRSTSVMEMKANCPSMASGDFNRDGKLDLALVSYDDEDYSRRFEQGVAFILIGDGKGGFKQLLKKNVAPVPFTIVTGDFNGDTLIDLAVQNQSRYISNKISVLLGDGTGQFEDSVESGSGTYRADSMSAVDVDADGLTDLAIFEHFGFGELIILHGMGMGRFGLPVRFKHSFNSYSSSERIPQIADFNDDKMPDISGLINNSSGNPEPCVLLNDGKGNFPTATCYPGSSHPDSLIAADFNQDLLPDLVIISQYDDLQIFHNNGSGGFNVSPMGPIHGSLISKLQADYDGDGKLDLALKNGWLPSITVMLGGDKGVQAHSNLNVGPVLSKLMAADFDGDGLTDLAGIDQLSFFNVIRNGGGGRIKSTTLLDTGLVLASPLALGDLNGDTLPDVVVSGTLPPDNQDSGLSLLLNQGGGRLAIPPAYPVAQQAFSAALGLINRDSYLDLAVVSPMESRVSVLLGDGAGGFAQVIKSWDLGERPAEVAIADFNHDGSSDLIISLQKRTNLQILWGDKAANFSEPKEVTTGLSTAADWLTIADFDGDGSVDIAAVDCTASQVAVLLNSGSGEFKIVRRYPFIDCRGLSDRALLAADLNGDGRPELISAGFSEAVAILLNNGAGSFGKVLRFTTTERAYNLAVGDWDGDGKPDLLVNGSKISVMRNQSK